MTTLSQLGLVAACPGSASLHRYAREGDRAPTLGRAIHALLEDMTDGSFCRGEPYEPEKLAAMFELDADDAGRLAFLAAHLRLPVPPGALAEVPLGYWPDGSVRRVEGGAGSYRDDGQILSGTIDAMWAEPEPLWTMDGMTDRGGGAPSWCCPGRSTLWIVDWKTGAEEHVPPIDRNWQLRGAAVLAARWTGAQRVIPAICYVNAAECAEAVREGRVYAGRWEVGAPLDAAALDEIEREMLAVLARARGEGDANLREQARRADGAGGSAQSDGDGEGLDAGGGRVAGERRPSLVLGPHCDHCNARGACPALAREAVTLLGALEERDDEDRESDRGAEHHREDAAGDERELARRDFRGGLQAGPADAGGAQAVEATGVVRWRRELVSSGHVALTPARAAHLAGIIPALRSILNAAELAVRAHVEATGAPLVLADGREYGPALEEVRSYKTRPAYEALAAVVGDAAADEAFETTGTALRAALAGQPRGAWGRLKEDLEARGAVVVGAREVWRKKWPAKPVEVTHEDADRKEDLLRARPGHDAEAERTDTLQRPAVDRGGAPVLEGAQGVEARGPVDDVAPEVVAEDRGEGDRESARGSVPRAPCSLCGVPVAVTTKGLARKHQAPCAATYCAGSGKPPAKPAEQLSL